MTALGSCGWLSIAWNIVVCQVHRTPTVYLDLFCTTTVLFVSLLLYVFTIIVNFHTFIWRFSVMICYLRKYNKVCIRGLNCISIMTHSFGSCLKLFRNEGWSSIELWDICWIFWIRTQIDNYISSCGCHRRCLRDSVVIIFSSG